MNDTRVIELIGDDTAIHNASGISRKTSTKIDPIGPLIRDLIDEHIIFEDDLIVVVRGETPVFSPRLAASWAAYQIIDNDDKGFYKNKFKKNDFYS